MNNVVDLRGVLPAPPAPTLESIFGQTDALGLKLCAQWRMARAQQQELWAAGDIADGYGNLPSTDSHDTDPLRKMQVYEDMLARAEPHTVMLAREMLRVCLTVLVHQIEAPETVLADGPVIQIIQRVIAGLDRMPGTTRLARKRKRCG